jgi:hypothetical protein
VRPAGGSAMRARRRCGRRKKVAGWAMRWAGPAGRPRPSGGGEGNSAGKKRLGRKAGWAESDGENSFPNKI